MKDTKKLIEEKLADKEGPGELYYIGEVGPNIGMGDDSKPLIVKGLRTYHKGDSLTKEEAGRIAEMIGRFNQIREIKSEIDPKDGYEGITYHFQNPVYLLSIDGLEGLFKRYTPLVGPDVIIVARSSGSKKEREFVSWRAADCTILDD